MKSMLHYTEQRDSSGTITTIATDLAGAALLDCAKLNKGTAFSREERSLFHLTGRLPNRVENLYEQIERCYQQYAQKEADLQKNIYLNSLLDTNETLYYALVKQHLEEMLPIIYTPTIGEAVRNFSLQLRRTRGLYISYPDIDQIDDIIDQRINPLVDLIVATDGEGVLGIGDQGVGAMHISLGKLAVYTLCAGIHPNRRLPIQLDVGTNNEKLLNDPMYLGWRHPRIRGEQYDRFIDRFVTAVQKKLPGVFLHWEDFGRTNARRVLDRYREQVCSFNDDIQGTGIVTLSCILSAIQASRTTLREQKIVIFGAGTAGCGIADLICNAMQRAGMSREEAQSHFYMIDRDGLLFTDTPDLQPFQSPYARPSSERTAYPTPDHISLEETVAAAHPTILIGCSAQSGAFTEPIIRNMAEHTAHPIILPLSNPTSNAEGVPHDLLNWTDGKALIATGSPFGTIPFQNTTRRIGQSNNAFAFPGLGLGILLSKARTVTDNMLWAATNELHKHAPVLHDITHPLTPSFDDILTVSHNIAKAVAQQAVEDDIARIDPFDNLEKNINENIWVPVYYPYIPSVDS